MLKNGTPPNAPASVDNAIAVPVAGSAQVAGPNVTTIAVILLTVAVLYFGRDIFVPFALAILMGFLLAPPVGWLRHLHIPRAVAVLLVVMSAVAFIAGLSVLVGVQVVALANNLPTYQQTMQQKIRSMRAAVPGGSTLDRTTEVIEAVGRELSEPAESAEAPATSKRSRNARAKDDPLAVRVIPNERHPLEIAGSVAKSTMGPIGTAGLVIVFVFFVLLAPSDLRDRFIRLAGSDVHRTTEALSDAAGRVSRYLLMQLVVNATYGIPLGIGLYMIGVPGAFLWALLATFLRFIPYLGPVIAAIPPLALAFAVDPGWHMLLWTAGLVLVLELISNNVIEPWLYGSSTGMTPMAVILSAIFWTLLWGPVGLILATPLTVCLVVMGRYVPQLAFIEVLLGSEPVLTSEERLYQRLLAGNVEEAIDIAESEVAEHSLSAFYEQSGLGALRLAENARERGASHEDCKKVADGLLAVMHDLEETAAETSDGDLSGPRPSLERAPVMCIAGRGELDAAAATLLVNMLARRGIGARLVPASAITLDAIASLDLAGVDVVCLSYLSPMPKGYARFVCRRLRARARHLKIVLGVWNLAPEAGAPEALADDTGADAAASTLDAVVHAIGGLVQNNATPDAPTPMPDAEDARIKALQMSGVLTADKAAQLDRVARNVAQAMDTPIGLVSLVDECSQIWRGASGLPEALQKTRQGAREMSICTHLVATDTPLVVEDTRRDARFVHNTFLLEHGMRFYAGVPLRTATGHVIGSLCVIDTRPRTLSAREINLMQVIADELMRELSVKEEAARGEQELNINDGNDALPASPT